MRSGVCGSIWPASCAHHFCGNAGRPGRILMTQHSEMSCRGEHSRWSRSQQSGEGETEAVYGCRQRPVWCVMSGAAGELHPSVQQRRSCGADVGRAGMTHGRQADRSRNFLIEPSHQFAKSPRRRRLAPFGPEDFCSHKKASARERRLFEFATIWFGLRL